MSQRILKAKEVAERTSVSTAQLYRMVSAGTFPKPIQITEHRKGWLEDDVNNWIGDCIRAQKQEAD